jgi:glycosyltransferase involved in cell wall biosynthesis
LGLESRVKLYARIDENCLLSAYASALAFLFPSRHEGFGLPLLEALRAGCPVLCSDTPVFREVAGEGAEYFSSDDAEGLSTLISALASDPELHGRVVRRGRTRVEAFSWKRTAAQTLEVYESVHSV